LSYRLLRIERCLDPIDYYQRLDRLMRYDECVKAIDSLSHDISYGRNVVLYLRKAGIWGPSRLFYFSPAIFSHR